MLGSYFSLSRTLLIGLFVLVAAWSVRAADMITDGRAEFVSIAPDEKKTETSTGWGTVILRRPGAVTPGKLLPAPEGNQILEVDPVNGLSQTIAGLTIGKKYILCFRVYGQEDSNHATDPDVTETQVKVAVTNGTISHIDGAAGADLTVTAPARNTDGTSWSGGYWQQYVLCIVPTATSITIDFTELTGKARYTSFLDMVTLKCDEDEIPDIPDYPPPHKQGMICWPTPDPTTYEGPLDLIVGEVDGDQDGQVEGNEDQEDEGRGIRQNAGTEVPMFAMVTHLLSSGTAKLRIDVPEWVRVEDSEGNEVGGEVTWQMGGSHEHGNSRHFTIYSNRPVCECWFHLTVDNPGPPSVTLSPTEDSADLYADCTCDPSSSTGKTEGGNNSVDVRIDLGSLRYGDSAGYLHLKASSPSAGLYTPGALQVFAHNDLVVTDLDQDGGTITAPLYASDLWGAAKVTVVSSTEYRIAFYEDENTMAADTANTAATAFRVLTVEKPAGTSGNSELYITEQQSHSGTTTRYWHYEFSSAGGVDTWVLTEGKLVGAAETPLRVTRRQENTSGAVRTETLGVYKPDHNNFAAVDLVYEVEEVYEEFAWGEEMTRRTIDPNGLALTETWTYGTSGGSDHGRKISYESATGYWERYRYTQDAAGMDYRDLTVRQLHDNALNLGQAIATAAQNNIAEYLTRTTHNANIGGGNNEQVYVEATQAKVEDVLETSTYKIVRENVAGQTAHDETWIVACTVSDPEDATGATGELDLIGKILRGEDSEYFIINRSWYWKLDSTVITDASDPGAMYKSLSADGVLTLIDRSYSFRRHTTVTESGYDDDGDEVIDYGTRTTVVQDPRGNVESMLSERTVTENGWFIESFVDRLQQDTFGRPTVTGYYFGADAKTASTGGTVDPAYQTFDVHACCGTGSFTSHTDRGGVRTRVDMDALGRQTKLTTGDGSTSMELVTEYGLDAAGNVLTMTRKPLASSAEPDLVTTSTYNSAGMLTSVSDPEGRTVHFTYGRVKASGSVYTLGVDTGHFWWEVRQYGEDNSVPVRVAWADSQGDSVLRFSATTSWNGVSAPMASEALTAEHTRSMTEYRWVTVGSDREYRATSRVYHDLYDYGQSEPLEMGLDDEGVDGTNYLVTSEVLADPLGRIAQATDAAGNILTLEYEDGTGMAVETRVGIDVGSLKTVATMRYNEFTSGTEQAPTGDRRPYPTRVYGVRPGLTAPPAPDAMGGGMSNYDYIEADVDFTLDGNSEYLVSRTVWTQPEHGPWSSQTFNAQSQLIESRTYKNGDTNTVLTATDYNYLGDATETDPHEVPNNGRLEYVDRFEVVSGTVQANSLRTHLYYNDAGFQIKTESPGRGLTKIELDDYGRIAREVFASEEGTNTDIEGSDAFTDDIVLTETIYSYNDASQVIQATSYDRAHDAPGSVTGLLSNAAASRSRVSYAANWYDDNGRLTHSATYGTNGGAAFTRPASAPAPGDDWIVAEVAYNAAGYAHLTTDNKGVQTRRYYNNAGQVTYVVENYDAAAFTDSDDPTTITARDADLCRITAYGYDFTSTNAAGLRITMTALDPAADGDGAGNQDDNQTTHFIYTGELDSGKRGHVPTNSRLAAVLHADAAGEGVTRSDVIDDIDNGTAGDFVYTEVYAGGEVYRVSDQRDARWVSTYTDEGYLASRSIGTHGAWTAPADSDLRYEYTYGDAGELLTVTAFDVASGGAANRTSSVTYTYDGFYQTDTETQNHNPPAPVGGKGYQVGVIDFDYDTTASGGIYTNARRFSQVTYPNGRVVKLYYTPGSIDHAISRASGIDEVIAAADTPITRYTYLGSGRLARKDYPGPDLRMDFIDEGTEGDIANDGYDASWDRFGRSARLQWERYDSNGDGAGVTGSDGENVFMVRHGYDRVGNKLYDQREVYGGYSNVRRFDGMHRMVGQDKGTIVLDVSGDVELDGTTGYAAVDDFWEVRGRDWELDQVNNPTSVDTESGADREGVAVNNGNEITELTVDATDQIDESAVYFSSADDKDIFTDSVNCTLSGTSDVEVAGGYLTIKTGSSTAPAIILTGENRGPIPFSTSVQSPSSPGLVGLVFGYKSPLDYWILVNNFAAGNGDWEIYHIHDADDSGAIDYTDIGTLNTNEKQLIGSYNYNNTSTNTWYSIYARADFNAVDVFRSAFDLSSEGGFPAGRYGLYTEVSNAKFDYFRVLSDGRTASLGAAWETAGNNAIYNHGGAGDGKVWTSGTWHRHYQPVLLRSVRAQRFQATFQMQRSSSSDYAYGLFVFNYRGPGEFDVIRLRHQLTPAAPEALSFRDGATVNNMTENRDAGEVPARTNDSDPLWYRVVSDGVDVKVFAATTEGGLDGKQAADEWCMRTTATTDRFAFEDGVGRFGFAGASYHQYWDNFTLETDPDNDADLTDPATYETVEFKDDFTLTSGEIEDHFVYDAAGNLTFNGYQRLTYDGNNRLIRIENAWWDDTAAAGSEVTSGSVVVEYRYDPLGRLIVDEKHDAEGLASAVHRYYVGHSEIETRSRALGGGNVLSQQVWDSLVPGRYIDSLAQVAHNLRPGLDDDSSTSGKQDLVDTRLYPMQDSMYCVLGLATAAGDVVERYEYDAYGRRFVYQRGGPSFAQFAWMDVNGDGEVGSSELDRVTANWGASVTAWDRTKGDYTGDGNVNIEDLDQVMVWWGRYGSDSNDTMTMSPGGIYNGSQVLDFGPLPGNALNDFGFQGLRHDVWSNAVYNRARWYDTDLGRYFNADPHPAIFPDGMSRFAAYHLWNGNLDPYGKKTIRERIRDGRNAIANTTSSIVNTVGGVIHQGEQISLRAGNEAANALGPVIDQAVDHLNNHLQDTATNREQAERSFDTGAAVGTFDQFADLAVLAADDHAQSRLVETVLNKSNYIMTGERDGFGTTYADCPPPENSPTVIWAEFKVRRDRWLIRELQLSPGSYYAGQFFGPSLIEAVLSTIPGGGLTAWIAKLRLLSKLIPDLPRCRPRGIGDIGDGNRVNIGRIEYPPNLQNPIGSHLYGDNLANPGATSEIMVIGRRPDTGTYSDAAGHNVLDTDNWNIDVNDGWVQRGIAEGRSFLLASEINFSTLRRIEYTDCGDVLRDLTVYFRELKMLRDAGYVRQGDYMVPGS